MKTFNQFIEEACWKDYEMIGTKKKDGKTVPNCVPKEEIAANSVGGGGVDMNTNGTPSAFVRRDKRKKNDAEQMYKRAKGTSKIKVNEAPK